MKAIQGATPMNDRDISCTTLIDTLSTSIDRVLEPLLQSGTTCALLDFQNHSNVGDSAIWLGESRWLARRGIQISYTCDITTYSRERLASRLGGGTILLSGGGNLGDFWI